MGQVVYEPRILRGGRPRHCAGAADPDIYTQRYAHADVLVIGAGPAGIAAAQQAAASGARVILADDRPASGVRCLRQLMRPSGATTPALGRGTR